MKKSSSSRAPERGNILFMILIAVVLLGALTMALTQNTTQQSDSLDRQTRDDQISRTFTYASTLASALEQMVVNGEDPATLYSSLSLLKPGEAGFETAPSNLKIYHPLGGGVTPMDASAPVSSPAATDFDINTDSIITGVGKTDAVIGDIVFTAKVSSEAICARMNEMLNGSTAVPVLATATFNDLFGGVAVTVSGANCASCVNMARLCVSNTGATEWGFYAALFPG